MPDFTDAADIAADRQAEKDVAITKAVREYFDDHLDTYPSALHLIYTVLDAAHNSPSCGGNEPQALRAMLIRVRHYVEDHDPASLPLLFAPKEN